MPWIDEVTGRRVRERGFSLDGDGRTVPGGRQGQHHDPELRAVRRQREPITDAALGLSGVVAPGSATRSPMANLAVRRRIPVEG